jgi:hypothetical protein
VLSSPSPSPKNGKIQPAGFVSAGYFFAQATGYFIYIEPKHRFELWLETMPRKKNAPQE